jgi:hypothetical protein
VLTLILVSYSPAWPRSVNRPNQTTMIVLDYPIIFTGVAQE